MKHDKNMMVVVVLHELHNTKSFVEDWRSESYIALPKELISPNPHYFNIIYNENMIIKIPRSQLPKGTKLGNMKYLSLSGACQLICPFKHTQKKKKDKEWRIVVLTPTFIGIEYLFGRSI